MRYLRLFLFAIGKRLIRLSWDRTEPLAIGIWSVGDKSVELEIFDVPILLSRDEAREIGNSLIDAAKSHGAMYLGNYLNN